MPAAPSWFAQVRLLMRAERQRAVGRSRAAAAKRKGKGKPRIGYAWSLLINCGLQAMIAGVFLWIASVANVVSFEQGGKLVVYGDTWNALRAEGDASAQPVTNNPGEASARAISAQLEYAFRHEARDREHERGGDSDHWHQVFVNQYARRGIAGFAPDSQVAVGRNELTSRVLALAIVVWWLSLVFQGEGINIDSMRRRHPMWEWYLSVPVPQTAVFVAEALGPAVGNPFVLSGPIMFAVLVGWLHGSILWGVAALPIGIPFMIAATLWAKALEVLIMLRSSVRNRGGWFAVLAALGYVLLIGPVLMLQLRSLNYALAHAMLPWIDAVPGAQALLGAGDPVGWLRAMVVSLAIGVLLAVPACMVMRFATAQGLESGFGRAEKPVANSAFGQRRSGWLRFLDDPLLRKELLWLKRDRGALIQLFGLPLILLVTQFANFHNMLSHVDMSWNRLAGIILFFATSLLAAAAPRALLSEGQGLMLTMSWPRSLEDTLRVKIRMLFALVTIMVLACLGGVAWMSPGDTLAICGVALLWMAMGLAVAEKAVTMLRTPDSSGQIEPLPRGRFQPANFGNTTLAIAVFTGQWQLAFAAIVMNWVFAAALWQKFRLHLAYLFDPGDEPEVRPPTVLSSVIAIVGLLELGAVMSIPFLMGFGKDAAPFARTLGYAIAAVVVSGIVVSWNSRRDLSLGETLTLDGKSRFVRFRPVLVALGGGALLALIGVGYQHLLAVIPWPALQDILHASAHALADNPNLFIAYAIAAVGIAPWVEEFLFRGLMFRAMLPQWGLARAALASAAFFTILHPWPAWPMVFALGVANALLFARARSLLPCIVLHATYNGVLLYLSF